MQQRTNENRSIFSHYFSLCATIVLVSTVLLGVMFVALFARYYQEENLDTLQKKATQAAKLAAFNYTLNGGKYIDSRVVSDSLMILSNAVEADFFLVDSAGKTALCVDDEENCRHKDHTLSPAVMHDALRTGYRSVGRLDGIYAEKTYVVGVPILYENVVIGAVFAGSNVLGMQGLLWNAFKIFLLGAVLVLLVAFVGTYLSTEALVRPLRAMLKASDSFAKGDFTVRVPVEGDEEIEQLARAFNNMASNLATLESTRRSFIANVSHELKTPMTTIGGFIDGILDGTIPQEKYPYYLGIVSNEVKRLSRMVVSMLNISRIEAGEMQLKPQTVDVHEIVCRTVLGFEKNIEDKHIDIIGLDAEKNFAEADPDLVHQIVYNLVENAVKFTPEYGNIRVAYHNDGKLLQVSIRNSGDGISKEELPRLFDRFYKSDRSRGIDRSGVGLGLHIVKSLVHLQGGTISVGSVEKEYTEFVFTLPLPAQRGGGLFRKGEKTKALPQTAE